MCFITYYYYKNHCHRCLKMRDQTDSQLDWYLMGYFAAHSILTFLIVIQKEGNLHASLKKVKNLDMMNYPQISQFEFYLVSFRSHFLIIHLQFHLFRYFNYLLLNLRRLIPHYILFLLYHYSLLAYHFLKSIGLQFHFKNIPLTQDSRCIFALLDYFLNLAYSLQYLHYFLLQLLLLLIFDHSSQVQ